MNGHKVNDVQLLYDDAKMLYDNYVVGSAESSADAILNNLASGIETLKNSWKGVDAGVQINSVIRVHNVMVSVRNALAQLAVDSTSVAVFYRGIQTANAAQMGELTALHFDARMNLSEYSDTADTIDITMEANTGKQKIDAANDAMDAFISNVKVKYNDIMNNWQAGTGRDNATEAFESFVASVNEYRNVLSEVSTNITTALQNYSLL